MVEWSDTWLMRFNTKKCHVMRMKRSHRNIIAPFHYHIKGSSLEEVDNHPYLGVELTNDLSWRWHVDQMSTKATGLLAFLRRNITKCKLEVKEKAYLSLIRPDLEYVALVWDPYRQYQIDKVEMVQHRGARFTTGQYSRHQSATTMFNTFKWT